MPDANAWSQPVPRTSSLIALGATPGLVYGYLEAAEVLILGAVPGVLAWRNGREFREPGHRRRGPAFHDSGELAVGARVSDQHRHQLTPHPAQ